MMLRNPQAPLFCRLIGGRGYYPILFTRSYTLCVIIGQARTKTSTTKLSSECPAANAPLYTYIFVRACELDLD